MLGNTTALQFGRWISLVDNLQRTKVRQLHQLLELRGGWSAHPDVHSARDATGTGLRPVQLTSSA